MRVPVVLLKKLVPVVPLVMTRGPFSLTYPITFSVRLKFDRSIRFVTALSGPAFAHTLTDPVPFPNRLTSALVARPRISGLLSNTNELVFR